MSHVHIPFALRKQVRLRARQRCEYCQTSEWLSGIQCEIDHIIPLAQEGSTTEDNLCLACVSCNAHKQAKTQVTDPESGELVSLFHPRHQQWQDHFAWTDDGSQIIGLTACGRATVEALQMNHHLIVVARAIWTRIGQHPPQT